jgi:hypothetical protein
VNRPYIKISVVELAALLCRIDDALEVEGTEYDTLFGLRDMLAELVEDPERMVE